MSLPNKWLSPKDVLFQERSGNPGSFAFDAKVARVFDDMIRRSVPGYQESLKATVEMAVRFALPDHPILDLGCSTANALIAIAERLPSDEPALIGIDSSEAMLRKGREKLLQLGLTTRVALHRADLADTDIVEHCVCILNYTLQFIPVLMRPILLARVFEAMAAGGLVILSEKSTPNRDEWNQTIEELYDQHKLEMGYEQVEIARKRSALKDILVPLTVDQNIGLLKAAGFRSPEILIKNLYFTTFIARK